MPYQRKVMVHLRDTDSTGVIYFAELQRMAQETLEMFLSVNRISVGHLVEKGEFLLPIVHAEADYHAPIRASDELHIKLSCIRVGDKSFTLQAEFENIWTKQKVGVVKLVHVTVDKKTFSSIELPLEVKTMLSKIQEGV